MMRVWLDIACVVAVLAKLGLTAFTTIELDGWDVAMTFAAGVAARDLLQLFFGPDQSDQDSPPK